MKNFSSRIFRRLPLKTELNKILQAPSHEQTVEALDQRFVLTPAAAREGYLVHLVQSLKDKKSAGSMIIFVKTCKTCEVISMMLNYFEFQNVSLHSQKSQRERLAALVKFRSNQVRSSQIKSKSNEYIMNQNGTLSPGRNL